MAENKKQKPAKKDNVIFIDKKPTMSYVMAVMTQFTGGNNEVQIRARGRSISTAVDVAEAVRNKFLSDLKRNINIGTDEVKDKQNRKLNVSTISITLNK